MKVTLKTQIIGLVVIAALFPVAVMSVIIVYENLNLSNSVTSEIDTLTRDNIEQIASDVYELCKTADDLIQKRLDTGLRLSRRLLAEKGGLNVGPSNVKRTISNQYSAVTRVETLPVFRIGKKKIEEITDLSVPVPVVDEVRELVGCTCTVFQKINEDGDMLRIATNVATAEGRRAVGSYIPAVHPDGTPDPVISTVLQGSTYRGYAYVMNERYITAYEPVRDGKGIIIGMLHVGISQRDLESVRSAILNIKVGKTGYVYVLKGTGSDRGTYIISKDGKRDEENIWNATDSDNNYFIRNIIEKALKQGENATEEYFWKNPGDKTPRKKIAAIKYFEPWDWVIGAGMYLDDYHTVRKNTISALNKLFFGSVAAGLVLLLVVVLVAVFFGNKIVRPIQNIITIARQIAAGDLSQARRSVERLGAGGDTASGDMKTAADETGQLLGAVQAMTKSLFSLVGQVQRSGIQVTTSSTQIAASARQLEATVTEQAAATKQVVATSKEISTVSQDLAGTMNEVSGVALETSTRVESGRSELVDMEAAIRQLLGASGSISSKLSIIREKTDNIDTVITTINKIAEQTNLLSLNAAIEAEKAGEYGIGFSVVAREIRRLADQTAVATLDIEQLVKEMQSAVSAGVMEMDKFSDEVNQGVENITRLSSQLETIIEQVQALPPRFQEVNEGMQSQADGARQISESMVQLNEAIQQTTESLREFNNATGQLNEAARGLQQEVSRFKVSE